MTTLDLHPEDLLDKALHDADELLTAERDQLSSHLAQCKVCRFELAARADFRKVLALGDFEPFGDASTKGHARPPPTRARPHRRTLAFAAAAAASLVTVTAMGAVAQWAGVWHRLPALAQPERWQPSFAAGADPSLPQGTPTGTPAPSLAPPSRPPAKPLTPSGSRPAALSRPPALMLPPAGARLVDGHEASVLFDAATRARDYGDTREAIALYRTLAERYPSAPEAPLTEVELGRLLLDTGDAEQALEPLKAYLRGGNRDVREEVLYTVALAFSRLHRADDEATAWSELIRGYPHSVHVELARARLREIGTR